MYGVCKEFEFNLKEMNYAIAISSSVVLGTASIDYTG